MSEEFALLASWHHPAKGVFVLATQGYAIIGDEIIGCDPRTRCTQIAPDVLLHLLDLVRCQVEQDGGLYVADAVFHEEVDHTGNRRCRVVEAFVTDFAIVSRIILEERHRSFEAV